MLHKLLHGAVLNICLLIAGITATAQDTKITIKLLGHDGKPLAASHAVMTRTTFDAEAKILPSWISSNTFQFSVEGPGVYKVYLAGVHHQVVTAPILIENRVPVAFEVRLGTFPKHLSHPDSVFLIGNFNNLSAEKGLLKMTRQKDGSYTTQAPVLKDTLLYKPVLYSQGDPVQVDATDAEQYVYDSNRRTIWGGGHFYALAKEKTKTKIVFRPQLLLTNDLPPKILFSNPNLRAAKLVAAFADINRRLGKMRLAWYNFIETKQLGDNEDFYRHYDVSIDLSYLLKKAQTETDTVVRDLLNVASFQFALADTSRARKFVASVSPRSPVWQIASEFNWSHFFLEAIRDGNVSASFAEQIANATKERHVRAAYLGSALETFHKLDDEENTQRLYKAMMKEFETYPYFISMIKERIRLKKKIIKGNTIPDFSLTSLDQAYQTITPSSLKGKTYLIDLWATWCTPCVAEMKNLHRVYDKYKNKGFTIVSLSFDNDAERVASFRKKRWDMPWFNTIVNNTDSVKMQEIFEMQGLPRAILVDANGTIVAIDEELKGERLEEQLVKLTEARVQ